MLPRDHYLKQAFTDAVNFPNGFEKGGLSDIQARLIRKHGTLISALTEDEVSDASSEDLHILKVITNQSTPKNPVEQAWVKYLAIVKALNAKPTSKASPKAKPAKAKVEPATPAIEITEAPIAEKPKKATKAVAKKEPEEAPAKKVKVAAPKAKTTPPAVAAEKKPAKKPTAKK